MYKNKSKWLSAIFAIALMAVVSLSFAFKASHSDKKVFATKWYQYNGSGSTNVPSSYTLMALQPSDAEAESLCPGRNTICVIKAAEGPLNQPANFTIALTNEINNALNKHEPSDNVKLKE